MNKYSIAELGSLNSVQQKFDAYSPLNHIISNYKPINSLLKRSVSAMRFPAIDKRPSDELSLLSKLENSKAMLKTVSIGRIDAKTAKEPVKIVTSNLEFNKIIKNLDRVISNENYGQRRVILEEGNIAQVNLEAGCVQLFAIFPQGKQVPIKVKIERKRGKKGLISYMSRKIQFPNEDQHDAMFNKDEFEIADSGVRDTKFTTQRICLNIKAVEACQFVIGVSFGRILSKEASDLFKKKNNEACDDSFEKINPRAPVIFEEDSLDRKLSKIQPKVVNTNFVIQNIKRAQSCTRFSDNLEKRDISELRRRKVVSRHSDILAEQKLISEIKLQKPNIKKLLISQTEKINKIYQAKFQFEQK